MHVDVWQSGIVPLSHYRDLAWLADENDGLFTSAQARGAGFTDSSLVRMLQRGKLERVSRGVYRIPFTKPDRFAQYREVVLWAASHRGPDQAALSHETALVIYGISDANPAKIHLTIPRKARMRRKQPGAVTLHHAELQPEEIILVEGIPVTSVERTVSDLLKAKSRLDVIRQAVTGALREGYISSYNARRLRARITRHVEEMQDNG